MVCAMRYLKSIFLAMFAVACFGVSSLQAGNDVDIGKKVKHVNQHHKGNFYAAGEEVSYKGKIDRNSIMLGNRVDLRGSVGGGLIAMAEEVNIDANITGNAHIFAQKVMVRGHLGKNVRIVAEEIIIDNNATIAGNLRIIGEVVQIGGRVGGNVLVTAEELVVLNEIGKNLTARTDLLVFGRSAYIGGDLITNLDTEIVGGEDAEISGVQRQQSAPLFQKLKRFGFAIALSRVMNFFCSLIIGLLLIYTFPKFLTRLVENVQKHTGKSFWYGLLATVCAFFLFFMFMISIVGIGLALMLLLLSLFILYTAKLVAIIWVSNRLFSKWKLKPYTWGNFIVGLIAYLILITIPVLGTLLSLLFTFWGIGSLALVIGQRKRKA